MFQGCTAGAVLLMGGEGSRFGNPLPKQFHILGDKPLYRHALDTLLQTEAFDQIILVCNKGLISLLPADLPRNVSYVPSGASRQESSFLGLKGFSSLPDLVLIHDAVRPFVTREIIFSNLETALDVGAADTCIPSADTLIFAPGGKSIASIPDRSDLQRGQTPQTFRSQWIFDAHKRALQEGKMNATDDCSLVLAAGYPVAIVPGSEQNFKITSAFDLMVAELVYKKSTQHLLSPND